jgi:hypothetical protein
LKTSSLAKGAVTLGVGLLAAAALQLAVASPASAGATFGCHQDSYYLGCVSVNDYGGVTASIKMIYDNTDYLGHVELTSGTFGGYPGATHIVDGPQTNLVTTEVAYTPIRYYLPHGTYCSTWWFVDDGAWHHDGLECLAV